jgi:hypothetical protein
MDSTTIESKDSGEGREYKKVGESNGEIEKDDRKEERVDEKKEKERISKKQRGRRQKRRKSR